MYFIESGVNVNSVNVWIVAIDHELQLIRDSGDSDKRRAQKERLEVILEAGIPGRQVQFIAEESKLDKATIAMVLAAKSIPTIPWINIIMTDSERDAASITEALKNRPGHPDYDTMEFWIERRIPEDEIREAFFIKQTLSHAGDARSILMLLGDLHVNAVGEKLKAMGHQVTTDHELFPVKRWE
jgi:hypothetical protein